jgi:hypothetical protein
MKSLHRCLRNIFTALVALVLLFEEWGWEPLSALLARLARLQVWAWVERRIAALPPWGAVAIFLVPAFALFPIKLLALFVIGRGHVFMGVVVLLAAKVVGTAVLARLFTLTQPSLMRLAWFARWYPRWKNWKDKIIAEVRRSRLWQMGRRWKDQVRASFVLFRWRNAAATADKKAARTRK